MSTPRPRHLAVLAAFAAALGLLPGSAMAQRSNAPPGNSGVQEYLETIPDGSGKRATNDAGHRVRGPLLDSGVVRDATRRRLQALGDRGEKVAALAEATAPKPARSARPGDSDGESAVSGVARTAAGEGGDGGMGILLPLLLLAALAGAVGYALRRQAKS